MLVTLRTQVPWYTHKKLAIFYGSAIPAPVGQRQEDPWGLLARNLAQNKQTKYSEFQI